MRVLLALTTAFLLLLGVAAPHHHAAGGAHDCVACTVGGGLEARDETPALAPVGQRVSVAEAEPGPSPVTGAPMGAVPGQSPPA
ncbi:MAG TPA: hypothetical protein VFM45_02750 [Anaeromyxobacteraceae bacterium]|nr:hypothetical protein [Anaeromyxobacteraceae bacterium]